jgi:hypothetical protein
MEYVSITPRLVLLVVLELFVIPPLDFVCLLTIALSMKPSTEFRTIVGKEVSAMVSTIVPTLTRPVHQLLVTLLSATLPLEIAIYLLNGVLQTKRSWE